MEQSSNKHGAVRDEILKQEVEGLVRGDLGTRTEDFFEPEAPEQPVAGADPESALLGGVPPGMTPQDVALRSQLAAYLGKSPDPASAEQLAQRLRGQQAPDRLIALVEKLPADQEFHNVREIAVAMGLSVESQRF